MLLDKVQRALIERIRDFLLELGSGFAFLGSDYVEYALRDVRKPLGVSEIRFTDALPKDLQESLPAVDEIEAELSRPQSDTGSDG